MPRRRPTWTALLFAHSLVRDAAYNGAPKRRRADIHERLAAWMETRTTGRAGEHHEITGFHLARACLYLGELEPINARARGLGRRASEHLGLAGRTALALDASDDTTDLYRRAVSVLDPLDEAITGAEALDLAGVAAHAILQRAWADLYLEGHVMKIKGRAEGEDADDVEGHGARFQLTSTDPEVIAALGRIAGFEGSGEADVEGQGLKIRVRADDEDGEVEGHAFKIKIRADDDGGQEAEVEGHVIRVKGRDDDDAVEAHRFRGG